MQQPTPMQTLTPHFPLLLFTLATVTCFCPPLPISTWRSGSQLKVVTTAMSLLPVQDPRHPTTTRFWSQVDAFHHATNLSSTHLPYQRNRKPILFRSQKIKYLVFHQLKMLQLQNATAFRRRRSRGHVATVGCASLLHWSCLLSLLAQSCWLIAFFLPPKLLSSPLWTLLSKIHLLLKTNQILGTKSHSKQRTQTQEWVFLMVAKETLR